MHVDLGGPTTRVYVHTGVFAKLSPEPHANSRLSMNFGARKVFAADAFPPQWVVDEDAKHVQMFRTCSGSASQRAPTTATHKTPASANSLFFMAMDAVEEMHIRNFRLFGNY